MFLQTMVLISTLTTTSHESHEGFSFRAQVGPTYAQTTAPFPIFGDTTFSGWGASFNLSFGGTIIPNLSVGGNIGANVAVSPKLSYENGNSMSLDDTTYGISTIGTFVNYYIMPWNIFVTFSPMLTFINLQQDNLTIESDAGFGFRLEVGKEWWVSSNWGLGVSAYFMYSRNDSGDNMDIKMNTINGGLMLSATFN